MIYRAIGVMSGSSLDGLDIAYSEFQENSSVWSYEIIKAACFPYNHEWSHKLKTAISMDAYAYQLLHVEYGHHIGHQINEFINKNDLQYKVALIASHGHTTFHVPSKKMTAQLGDGAAIASETELPVVTDLRALDLAFGGQGAPIVPIGEKYLLGDYDYFLNLGGIANVSLKTEPYIAFDICAANRVLNMLIAPAGKEYDDQGAMARSGNVHDSLLQQLNTLDYYSLPYPKSLANDFGTDTVYPIVVAAKLSIPDALRTYLEHIVAQIKKSVADAPKFKQQARLLATGGGAFNTFMIERLTDELKEINVEVRVADKLLIEFKEAMIMAFMGVLRWRQEYNTIATVTGASRDSIGGALWNGQEA